MDYSKKPNKEEGEGGGGWGVDFHRHQRNSMWNFQGLIKNEVDFPRQSDQVSKKSTYTHFRVE